MENSHFHLKKRKKSMTFFLTAGLLFLLEGENVLEHSLPSVLGKAIPRLKKKVIRISCLQSWEGK